MVWMDISFYKLVLADCDFLLINALTNDISEHLFDRKSVDLICDRRRGVGGDGIILLYPSREQNVGLHFLSPLSGTQEKKREDLNASALLCASRFAFDFGLFNRDRLVIEGPTKDIEITCIDSTLFQIELGIPISLSGEEIKEDDRQEVHLWKPLQDQSIAYTCCSFSEFPARATAMVPGIPETERAEAFCRHVRKQDIGSAVFAVAEQQSLVAYSPFPAQGPGDAVIEAAAATLLCASGGSSGREVTARKVNRNQSEELYVTWTGSGSLVVGGVPHYVFTGNYSTEEKDGPAA
jgi:diaminopimelate epimerase